MLENKKDTSLVKIGESQNVVLSRDPHSRNTSQAQEGRAGKSGWAKGNPRRKDPQINEGEHDEWASYGRDIKVRRDGGVCSKVIKKQKATDKDFEDDGW